MRNGYFIFLILVFSIVVPNSNIHARISVDSIKIMTYNIRLDHAGDNENNWHKRKMELADFLIKEDCDFIGVQEALFHQLDYLNTELNEYSYIGLGREDGKNEGEFSAILFKKEWKVVENGNFWLSETPSEVSKGWDAACIRICSWGIFENDKGKKFLLLNTHFDHVGQEARSNSMDIILDFIIKKGDKIPVAFMGDLNFTPDNPIYQKVTDHLNDSYRNIGRQSEENRATFNGFSLEGPFIRRIDYIFTNDAFEVMDFYIDRPMTTSALHLSDHFPVIAKLKF